MSALSDFRLEVYFSRWEFNARYHMTASDAESMPLAELLALADDEDRNAWESMGLGYTQTWGDPRLREIIASTYDRIAPEQILCFAGAQEGLWCAMQAILTPGDHAVVTVPNYQSLESLPVSICGENVTGVPLRAERNWRIDLDEFERALRPNTRLVAINFPNNPTGAVPPRDDFERIVAACAQRNIVLFSDEVYRGVERNPAHTLPQAADLYEHALSLNVVSKAYGFPGLRVGWIASRNRALLERMERLKHYLSICNAAPSEILARVVLKNRARILERTRALCSVNLERLRGFFDEFGDRYEWRAPEGGCTAYPRYLGADGVEEHCRRLIEEAGILLLPASIYASSLASTPNDRFRVGYGRAAIEAGLDAWRAYLSGAAR